MTEYQYVGEGTSQLTPDTGSFVPDYLNLWTYWGFCQPIINVGGEKNSTRLYWSITASFAQPHFVWGVISLCFHTELHGGAHSWLSLQSGVPEQSACQLSTIDISAP